MTPAQTFADHVWKIRKAHVRGLITRDEMEQEIRRAIDAEDWG